MTITAAKLQVEVGGNITGAQKALGTLNSQVQKAPGIWKTALGTGLGFVGAQLAVQGVAAVKGFVTAGMSALKDEQAVVAQTAAGIKSTGGAAGVSAGQVRGYAEELSKLGGTDEDVVQGEENILLTFNKIKNVGMDDIFRQAAAAALDMSRRMGTDVTGTALQLGKALQDPVAGMTALRRSGVAFSAQQQTQIKDLVKHNKLLEAQKLILHEVNVEFGGSEAAFGATDAGKLAKYDVALEEVQKTFARGLLPVVADVADSLSQTFEDPAFLAGVENTGKSIGALVKDIPWKDIVGGIKTAADATAFAVKAFNDLPGPVKAALVGGFLVNKVTGGLITGIVGKAAGGVGGLIGGLRGSTPATPVFVADVTGGGIGGAAKGLPLIGGIGAGTLLAGAGITAVAAAAVGAVYMIERGQVAGAGSVMMNNAKAMAANPEVSVGDLKKALAAAEAGQKGMNSNPLTQFGGLIFGADQQLNDTIKGLKDAIASREQTQQQERGYSIMAGLVRDMAKGKGYDQGNALIYVRSLNDLFRSSLAPSQVSMRNSLHNMEALEREARSHGDTTVANAIRDEEKTLAELIRSTNATLISLPGDIAGSMAGWIPPTSSFRPGEKDLSPTPKAPPVTVTKNGRKMNAVGAFGVTNGLTDLGYAGEAGDEAVAIIRNPRPIRGQASTILKVFTTVSTSSVQRAATKAGLYGRLVPNGG